MCPARRTVNVKSICPASVNHVSYRVRSRGFSLAGRPLQAARVFIDRLRDSLNIDVGIFGHAPSIILSTYNNNWPFKCYVTLFCSVHLTRPSPLPRKATKYHRCTIRVLYVLLMCMYRSTFIVCNFQVYFLFLLINIFIFHIDIVYECRPYCYPLYY